uniref:Reverse transcriptase domain-containing protein n=1 Tax=Tanacetum cinerariifolium TaxID=118510 RepID=A0A6L2L4V1_TANCI|nr:hypothetical protein [Tanacetum cinerariifolium]
MNQKYFEPNPSYNSNYSGFDQPLQYSIDHQEDLNQQMISDVHGRWDKLNESHNELLNMMQSFCEMESTIPLNEIISQDPPSIVITPVLPNMEPKDFFIVGDEDLSTIPKKESNEVIKSSVEDLVPIPSEFEDTSRSDSEHDLSSCDDFSLINILKGKYVTFSNPLFDLNDDFTSSDDESLSDEDELENIENKGSYDSNLDEPDFLVTPLSDANEDKCFDPGDDVDKIELLRDPCTPKMSVASIFEGFTNEPPLE